MKKKIISAIEAAAVAALLVAITAFTQNHNTNSDSVAENMSQRYTSMVQDGAIEVGFKVTHKDAISSFGSKAYQFNIDCNGKSVPLEVDEATYNQYDVGDYITCAYVVIEDNVQIAPKPAGSVELNG